MILKFELFLAVLFKLFHLVFLKIVTWSTNERPRYFFLIMTQVELAESVFAKLAESMDVATESGETMELGK